jgi:transposase
MSYLFQNDYVPDINNNIIIPEVNYRKGMMIIRKVELNMKELDRYKTIKKLVETGGNKTRAAISIGCSKRHINRMIQGYKEHGKEFFLHGNHGRKPATKLPDEQRKLIIDLYNTKYSEANFTHYAELLRKQENINVSTETIRTLMLDRYTLSPKAKKGTKVRIRKKLEAELKAASSKKDSKNISSAIVEMEQAHPRKPRCAHFGELLQLDASVHPWFANFKSHLHVAVDDSCTAILGAYFDTQETLKGYYNVAYQVITGYGIPFEFLTDRRTVFEYKSKRSAKIDEDTFTQFSYACKQLGIQIKTTSVPQAKGRVERLFGTLQSRLPIEMRLAGVTTIEQANIFINHYIKEFNSTFSSISNISSSVFETQPSEEKLNLTLAVLSDRVIDSGHCIRFKNKFYKLVDSHDVPVYFRAGTKVLVIKAFNGDLFASTNDIVYSLSEVPSHELYSENFSFVCLPKVKRKIHIPAMSHPWKSSEFNKFAKAQKHYSETSFEEASNAEYPIFNGTK